MRVLVAGGGIGGLTTALSLHEAGIDVVVYEAAPAMRELGVGINLLPHAVRALSALGLQSALASTVDRDARARLLHKARQTDLARAARPECRLPLATVFNPSRPIADDSRARRRGASGRVCHSHRPPPHPFRAGRHGRDGPFRRSRKRSSRRQRPGRCVDRRRRHPLQGTRGALPGRGAAAIHRNHHVARHHRTGTLPR